ncbi:LacI family DNA-binding transcriptional regulator [Bifidobacterium simiarum]|uniref:LacI family transcriptional regulator n=1 Tax=Bifidobacterium simiarum TaxID=2045441 RepID=A0A2M9HEC7_9BIFI|nr:LacI family DNA-binding transcriptional regulator [Bifidobacterium simiarum]PJM75173.1 LacI family transcriptional regulator [Bifidobacterium simiarum]
MAESPRKRNNAAGTAKLADIARQTGVSVATVSKVLNGRTDVASKTRKTVQEALRQAGYTKRIATVRNRRMVEVVFQYFDSLWGFEIMQGVLAEAREHGLSVITTESGDRRHPDSAWLDEMLHRQPLGVILMFANVTDAEKRKLERYRIPYVTIDPSGDPSPDTLSVLADNWTGGVLATRHLLSLGHTRIGVITGPDEMMCSKARFDGFASALSERGLTPDPDLVREGNFQTSDGYRHGLSLLKDPRKRPTAIFAFSDLEAMGVYEAARQLRLRIPEDLSVIGFDDVSTSAFLGPALTTVRQPLQDMARAATSMIIDRSNNKAVSNPLILPTTLMVRDSTCPPARRSDD